MGPLTIKTKAIIFKKKHFEICLNLVVNWFIMVYVVVLIQLIILNYCKMQNSKLIWHIVQITTWFFLVFVKSHGIANLIYIILFQNKHKNLSYKCIIVELSTCKLLKSLKISNWKINIIYIRTVNRY